MLRLGRPAPQNRGAAGGSGWPATASPVVALAVGCSTGDQRRSAAADITLFAPTGQPTWELYFGIVPRPRYQSPRRPVVNNLLFACPVRVKGSLLLGTQARRPGAANRAWRRRADAPPPRFLAQFTGRTAPAGGRLRPSGTRRLPGAGDKPGRLRRCDIMPACPAPSVPGGLERLALWLDSPASAARFQSRTAHGYPAARWRGAAGKVESQMNTGRAPV